MRYLKVIVVAAVVVFLIPRGALAGSVFDVVPEEVEIEKEAVAQVMISGVDSLGGFYLEAAFDRDVVDMRVAPGEVFDGRQVVELEYTLDEEDKGRGYGVFAVGDSDFPTIKLPEGVLAQLHFIGLKPDQRTDAQLTFRLLLDEDGAEEEIVKKLEVTVIEAGEAPQIGLEKSVSPETARPGENVKYTFTVTNTGDLALRDIVLTDDQLKENWYIEHLDVGAAEEMSAQYTICEDAEGTVRNTATVTAEDADEGATVHATATAALDILDTSECAVTVVVEGQGEVKPPAGKHIFEKGQNITLQAAPEAGWRLDGWLIDDDRTEVEDLQIDISADEDMTVTAVFVREPVVLAYVGELVTPEGGARLLIEGLISMAVPPGAVASDTELGVTPVVGTEEVCAPDGPVDDRVFELTADTLQDGEEVEEFAEPMEVSLYYEDMVEQPERVAVHYYHDALDLWIPLPTEVDADRQLASTRIDRPADLMMCIKDQFADIDGHWAETDILFLTEFAASDLCPDTYFDPDELVTREQFAVMLVETAGVDVQSTARRLPFLIKDSDEISEWARPYVEAAMTAGLIEGYPDDTFRPQGSVTRAQVAAMLSRALGLAAEGEADFADADEIPQWAAGHVAALVELEIIEGLPGGLFAPQHKTTRAQAATFLCRYLQVRIDR